MGAQIARQPRMHLCSTTTTKKTTVERKEDPEAMKSITSARPSKEGIFVPDLRPAKHSQLRLGVVTET